MLKINLKISSVYSYSQLTPCKKDVSIQIPILTHVTNVNKQVQQDVAFCVNREALFFILFDKESVCCLMKFISLRFLSCIPFELVQFLDISFWRYPC